MRGSGGCGAASLPRRSAPARGATPSRLSPAVLGELQPRRPSVLGARRVSCPPPHPPRLCGPLGCSEPLPWFRCPPRTSQPRWDRSPETEAEPRAPSAAVPTAARLRTERGAPRAGAAPPAHPPGWTRLCRPSCPIRAAFGDAETASCAINLPERTQKRSSPFQPPPLQRDGSAERQTGPEVHRARLGHQRPPHLRRR